MKTFRERIKAGQIVFGGTVAEYLRPSVVKSFASSRFVWKQICERSIARCGSSRRCIRARSITERRLRAQPAPNARRAGACHPGHPCFGRLPHSVLPGATRPGSLIVDGQHKRSSCPQHSHVVASELLVARDDRQTFHPRLRDLDSIERILMVRGQLGDGEGMFRVNGYDADIVVVEHFKQIGGVVKSAERFFDGHLPNRGGADMNGVGRVGDDGARIVRKALRIGQPPQQHVGVEQVAAHSASPLKADWTSSGSGASKSSAMRT